MSKQKKPRRNRALFDKIADAIARRPHHYDQTVLGETCEHSCGTAHCVAGWAVALSGYKPGEGNDWNKVRKGRGPAVDSWSEGYKLLGLTPREANTLFAPHWKPDGVVHSVVSALRAIGRGADVKSVSGRGRGLLT